MANKDPIIDYTSKDYFALRQSMLEHAARAFPDWNTSSEGDFGVLLVELFAYAGDILSYYGDRISQEAYLPTATQRISLLNISELLGYVPSNGTPAVGTVTFITDDAGVPVTVPAGTQVITDFVQDLDQPIIFETDEDVLVPGDGGIAEVAITQGETRTMVPLGTSDGQPEQVMVLPDLGAIDGTVKLFVETAYGNEEWYEIDFMVDANPDDRVFTVRVDDQGRTILRLGDNVNGLIPTTGLQMWATYRVGIGSAGNVGAGSINAVLDPISGVDIQTVGGIPVTSETTDGTDPETIEQIRANAPLAFRTQFRAVTLQDFQDLAMAVPGILKAKAVANYYTSITLHIVGPNKGIPSDKIVDKVMDFFEDKMLAGVTLTVKPAVYVPINMGSDTDAIQLRALPRHRRAVVEIEVTKALQNLFSLENVQFGQYISVSDLYHAVMGVEGVDYVSIPFYGRDDAVQTGTADIQLRDSEIPVPGEIVIETSGGIG